ncbi:MAG: arylsulfatase [Verrucomicrobiota bacterium]
MRFLPIFVALSFAFVTADERHPNVLIVLVDDMGYGDAKCYNPESQIETPVIDQLAAEGMRFLDAHAPGPLCHLSRYGLMTGTYPFRTDISVWPTHPVIQENEDTIAKLLKRAGYRTSMVGKWHLGFLETGYENPLPGGPVDQGFETYFGMRASTDIPPYFYIEGDRAVMPPTDTIEANATEGWSPIQGEFWREGGISPDLKLEEVTPRFTDEAIQVIEQHDGENPLLLYLAYPSPHTPWLPSADFARTSDAGMYGDFMTMVDDEVGKVLAALEAAGMTDNTLVLFTSDNGPVWYEEDVERLAHDSSGGYRGMKADAWEAGHRMPFIVRWPGVVEAGTLAEKTISFTDLYATLADVVGEELGKEAGPDSFSFLETLEGGTCPERAPVVMESGRKLMTIRWGDWKLIEGQGSGGFSKIEKADLAGEPAGQLYDLSQDPGETKNRYEELPEVVERLRSRMEEIVSAGRSR